MYTKLNWKQESMGTNQTNNVIHWKGRNGAWDKRYSGFLNEGNCETGNLALIKLLAVPFQYFISFH